MASTIKTMLWCAVCALHNIVLIVPDGTNPTSDVRALATSRRAVVCTRPTGFLYRFAQAHTHTPTHLSTPPCAFVMCHSVSDYKARYFIIPSSDTSTYPDITHSSTHVRFVSARVCACVCLIMSSDNKHLDSLPLLECNHSTVHGLEERTKGRRQRRQEFDLYTLKQSSWLIFYGSPIQS